MNIPTPHIEAASQDLITKTVIMPGDPLRAKYIADTFLKDVVQFNSVRGMLGFTGIYKGKRISVMGSGMGIPSMGIYSYELYNFYGVDNIIRIGSCGAYTEEYQLYDLILVKESFSESNYSRVLNGNTSDTMKSDSDLNTELTKMANMLSIPLSEARIHTSEVFYRRHFDDYKSIRDAHQCVAVEMESFALFANALELGKKAACILTVSDSLVTHALTSSEERQNSFTKMMELVLETAITVVD